MLAGGRSSRMGQDKALLPWKGSTLIQSVASEVFKAARNVTLIGSPQRYEKLGFPVIFDKIEGCGLQFIEQLLEAAERSGCDTLVPETPGGLEPLCAVYHAGLLPAVESAIHSKLLKMHDFISVILASQWAAPDPTVFRNLNTPQELSEAR